MASLPVQPRETLTLPLPLPLPLALPASAARQRAPYPSSACAGSPVLQTGLMCPFTHFVLFQLFAPHLSGFHPFPDPQVCAYRFVLILVTVNTTRWPSSLYLIHLSCVAGWDEVTAPLRAKTGRAGGLVRPRFPKYHMSRTVSFKDTSVGAPAWPGFPAFRGPLSWMRSYLCGYSQRAF